MQKKNKIILFVIAIIILSLVFISITNSKPVSLIAVGDTTGYNMQDADLSHLSQLFEPADIFLVNLEGSFIDENLECEKLLGQSLFVFDASFASFLKLAPITIANMGNNHALDCGSEGITKTKQILAQNDILSLGAGQNISEACEPLIVEKNGWTIAFVSYNFVKKHALSADSKNAGTAFLDDCYHSYQKLKQDGVDLIIASIHLGGSGDPDVNRGQIDIQNNLLNSGADVVIAHSPHIPLPLFEKNGKVGFFSIGNFIFKPDYSMVPSAHTTIVPKIDFYLDRMEITLYPVILDDDGIPHLAQDDKIISKIIDESKRQFNTIIELRDNLGHITISKNWLF